MSNIADINRLQPIRFANRILTYKAQIDNTMIAQTKIDIAKA